VPDTDDIPSNPSDSATFAEVTASRLSRRSVLGGGLAAAAVGFFGGGVLDTLAPSPAGAAGRPGKGPVRPPLLGFTAVPTGTADAFTVPPGYRADVLIPWGQPIRSRGPKWKPDASNTAAEQAEQIGMHHDGMHFFPIGKGPAGNRLGLLVVNHEYVDRVQLYPEGDGALDDPDAPVEVRRDLVAKALAAHGVSVVMVTRKGDRWQVLDSPYNRRVTGATPMTFSGPVRLDHPALATGDPVAEGTLNNCANGFTPWNTYLACEENWNGYFGTDDPSWTPPAAQARYGVNASGFGYRWHRGDDRFDLAATPNEVNRFGWVVEVDPFDPRSTPVKRTALGRIKHESATVTESKSRIVVYTGDDQDCEYVYKFVGSEPWRALRARRKSPLDHGTLYVARFDDDGSGTWLPLTFGSGPLTAENGWADQADVLLRTREAADALGATPMDRPEWVAVHPNNDVYLTCTNGSAGPNPPNPRNPNPYGHIVRWTEAGGDNTATTFSWDVFVLAGDPAYDDAVELDDDAIFGSPDGIWADPDGRVWIQTDISNSAQNRPDRGYDRIGNNQMLAADPATGEIRRFLVGPRGCEITGVITTPDQKTMFVNVQHPGESTTSWDDQFGAPSPANPRTVSNWPDFAPAGRPRSATVVIRKVDGGRIGT
jgi:uncharacterized protein